MCKVLVGIKFQVVLVDIIEPDATNQIHNETLNVICYKGQIIQIVRLIEGRRHTAKPRGKQVHHTFA